MVASSQVWWLLTGAPQGSEKLRQGSRVHCGHWGGCRIPTPGPRQATQGLEALPVPPHHAPAQQWAEVAARQAADRASLSAWTTQPPATLLLGLLFSFGGARADPRLLTGRALGAVCPGHVLQLHGAPAGPGASASPGKQSCGVWVPWDQLRGRVQGRGGAAAPRQLERRGLRSVRGSCWPTAVVWDSRGLALGVSMAQLASPGGHGS